jgi:response regulator RpfG family c-di-GMP phosphodiesterase
MKAADVLQKAQLLNQEQYDGIKRLADAMGERAEEILISNSIMTEADLLKTLSGLYKTKFASSQMLSKADVPKATLEMIPRKVCETFNVFPVMFDAQANTLSVVATDPDDTALLKELQLVSGAREVKAFFARPAAIEASIQKHHGRDARAFDRFDRERLTNNLASHGGGGITVALGGHLSAEATATRAAAPAAAPKPTEARGGAQAAVAASRALFLEMPPAPSAPNVQAAPPVPVAQPSPVGIAQRVKPAAVSALGLDAPFGATEPPAPILSQFVQAAPAGEYTLAAVTELTNVFVSLLENSRADLRGHSSHVARLARRLCERLTLPQHEIEAIVLAAHVHDLAKMGQFHLTALNVAEYDGHRLAAEKVVETPIRLLESVNLPSATRDAVRQMYERWNGGGFPQGLSGKEISLGARILTLTDVYADLTQNPRNPYRKQLEAPDACAVLTKHRERIFDPHLVDLFRSVVMGEDMKAKLLATRRKVLIVDPDPEESTVLELRMIEQGFEVKTARSVESAKATLAKGDIELVVSELTLPDGNGLQLLAEARMAPWGKELAWVIHTAIQNREEAQKAFEMGVLDFVSKPAPTDVFVAKMRALMNNAKKQASRGVSGSLNEMSLPDIVQVLFHGRKSGKLAIRSGAQSGEVHFIEGAVADAAFGKVRGVEAFYAMLKLKDGDFALDPTFTPPARVIRESSEGLLLEGLRRLDEGV